MDNVTDKEGKYFSLDKLDLKWEYKVFLKGALDKLARMNSRIIVDHAKYMKISKGMSTAIKIVIKVDGLYPLLAKMDIKEEIIKEYEGYQTLQFNMESSNLVSLLMLEENEHFGMLLYRYITKGRVKYQYDRFDTYLSKVDLTHANEMTINLIDNIFDVALKKCHWRDGQAIMQPSNWKDLCQLKFEDSLFTQEEQLHINQIYQNNIKKCKEIRVPHGIIHGDLHPKNVIIGLNNIPIIIDYAHVKPEGCIFHDYAKLETFFLFQVQSDISKQFFEIKSVASLFQRQYSTDPLILPRSTHDPISCAIQEIRTLLWKNCLSNTIGMDHQDIDTYYRAYLTYYFIQLCRRGGVSELTRKRSFQAILTLNAISEQ